MLGRLDYDAVERVEAELDSFIEKRAREREDANRTEALWAASEARHRERRREENRRAWRAYHLSQAERLEETARTLAALHRAKANALSGEVVA